MKQTFDIPRTEVESSQVDNADRLLGAVLFAILRLLGVGFLFLVILTIALSSFTTAGREYMVRFIVFLFTGENAIMLLAHFSGMFATIALICLLTVLAVLLHPQARRALRHNKDLELEQHSYQSKQKLPLDEIIFKR